MSRWSGFAILMAAGGWAIVAALGGDGPRAVLLASGVLLLAIAMLIGPGARLARRRRSR